jgi:hypothetical protein
MPRSLATRLEQRQGANEVGCAVSRDQPAEKTAQAPGLHRGLHRGLHQGPQQGCNAQGRQAIEFLCPRSLAPVYASPAGATARPR